MRRRSRKKEGINENAEKWLLPYADFVTILLALFMALFALSMIDVVKKEKFAESLRGVFMVMEAPIGDPIAIGEGRMRDLIAAIKEDIIGVEGAFVRVEPRGIVVTFPGAALFPSGSADIKRGSFDILKRLSERLDAVPGRITIEGHTDNVPLRPGGRFRSNWELSTARAASALDFFIQRGLRPARFSIAGYSEYRPVADNDTPEGRAKNRRVEIIIHR
ncbi:flagellar motor protein MotB [Thermodesulfovibrionales bacterium]|nr:flagellar motor protein MotB [Thermodesulfovibrionales bacterium]